MKIAECRTRKTGFERAKSAKKFNVALNAIRHILVNLKDHDLKLINDGTQRIFSISCSHRFASFSER